MWFKRIKDNVETNNKWLFDIDVKVTELKKENEKLAKEIKTLKAQIVEINELVASVKFLTVEAKKKEKINKIDKWLSGYPDESDKYSVGGKK